MLLVLMSNKLIIQVLLSSTQRASNNDLCFFRKLFLHIFLKSSKEEGTQNRMKLSEDLLTDRIVLFKSLLQGYVEPLVEIVEGDKQLGHQKVKQRPELTDVILQRSTC